MFDSNNVCTIEDQTRKSFLSVRWKYDTERSAKISCPERISTLRKLIVRPKLKMERAILFLLADDTAEEG